MSDTGDRSFWLCHSCGAQMRPIRVDGVPQCASCNSEFIEILDSSINPDPWHELPASPPTRPQSSPPVPSNRPSQGSSAPVGLGGMVGGLFSSLFGGGGHEEDGQSHAHAHPHAGQGDTPATAPGSPGPGSGSGGPRTYTFNIGNGTGSVTFGSFGGGGAGFGGGGAAGGQRHQGMGMGMGPFGPFAPTGPAGGDQGGGLDAFFPGFPPPASPHAQGPGRMHQPHQHHYDQHWHDPHGTMGMGMGRGDPLQGQDFFRALMGMLADEGVLQGPQGRMDMGDYVASQHGFDQVLERLMQAAGPQGPLPATDAVIEGLPRFKLDEQAIEKSPFKDCPVCKDDFVPDDEVMRVPCEHIFHVDCLQPWLKTNGSCPVCRFSLVPDDANRQARPTAAPGTGIGAGTGTPGADGGVAPLTNILQRLWGQAGSTAGSSSSPTSETPAGQRVYSPPTSPPPGRHPVYDPPTSPPPARASGPQSHTETEADPPETIPNSIPEDYRARHRQREQQQRDRNPYVDDLD